MANTKSIKQKLVERDGLRCSISDEAVSSIDELDVHHIVPIALGGSDEMSNLSLVKKSINRSLGQTYKDNNLIMAELAKRQEELAEREKVNFERERSYRNQIEKQKKELEDYRQHLQQEQAEHENFINNQFVEQTRKLKEQQAQMEIQMRTTEGLLKAKLSEVEAQKTQQTLELQAKEDQLRQGLEDLEKEKERYREESRKKIESKAREYVNDAITALESVSTEYHEIGKLWSIGGFLALLGGIITGLYFGIVGLTPKEGSAVVNWAYVAFFGFKGLIVIGLFVALAKYCFSYSQSFMHESLKNKERKHAINFGKFYLE